MRLLSSRETENNKNITGVAEATRITAIRSELSREERDLNTYKKDVQEQRKKIADDFEGKIMKLNDELSDLEDEVGKLRTERAELLKPLDDTPEKITENLAATDGLLKYLGKRKKEIEKEKKELSVALEYEKEQLQVLQDRENTLNQREVTIAERNQELKELEEVTAKNLSSMTSQMNRKNVELMLYEDSLNKTKVEIAERERLIAVDKEKIVVDRKHLESQQQTLIAAFAEAKQKQII